MSGRVLIALAAIGLVLAAPVPANADIRFQWVFAKDKITTEFFQPEIKKALQQAADDLTGRLGDKLEKRTISNPSNPGWLNFDPSNPGNKTPPTLASFFGDADKVDIPADTIVVLVGAHSFDSDRHNMGGSKYSFDDPNHPSQKNVDKRGTSHAVPYVGVVSFANDPGFTGPKPSRDFVANAQHELGHVLGLINKQVDWDANTRSQNGQQQYFVGPSAIAAYKTLGGVIDSSHPGVPLDIQTAGHWAPSPGDPQSTDQKKVGLLQTEKEMAIRATMQEFTKTRLTALDYAALKDIGWELQR
jgi:hypothetical protein